MTERFGRLLVADQTLALGLAPNPITLGLHDAGRVAARVDAEQHAEVENLFVGEPELSGKFVDANVLRQAVLSVVLI